MRVCVLCVPCGSSKATLRCYTFIIYILFSLFISIQRVLVPSYNPDIFNAAHTYKIIFYWNIFCIDCCFLFEMHWCCRLSFLALLLLGFKSNNSFFFRFKKMTFRCHISVVWAQGAVCGILISLLFLSIKVIFCMTIESIHNIARVRNCPARAAKVENSDIPFCPKITDFFR